MNELTILIPLKITGGHYTQNIRRFGILLQSLRHFYDGDVTSTVTIVCPDAEKAAVSAIFPGLTVLRDSDVVPGIDPMGASNWMKQQFIKLAFSEHCRTPFYLTLDPDNFATRHFGPATLISDGRAVMDVTSKEDHDYWWLASAETVGLAADLIPAQVMHVTPCLYAVQSIANLASDLAVRHDKSWEQVLLADHARPDAAPGWVENGIYHMNMVRRGDVGDFHKPGGTGNVLHNRNEVWISEQFENWDISNCFGNEDNGIFSVVQSNTFIPPEEVEIRIGTYIGL